MVWIESIVTLHPNDFTYCGANRIITLIIVVNVCICLASATAHYKYKTRHFDSLPRRFTNFWAVEIKNGTVKDARLLAQKYGFRLSHDPQVSWVKQQPLLKRVKRSMFFNDPEWSNMWYLNHNGQVRDLGMNIIDVWKRGYTGSGVVITIVDDGLEKDHVDIKDNYDPHASFDINGNDPNPEPRYIIDRDRNKLPKDPNEHGTRCAGVVAAVANNSRCVVGVAYNARIGGLRMLDGDITDAVEARALSFNNQHIHIYSASWGPNDDGIVVEGPHKLARKAFEDGIKNGRYGLGSIYVWASGNGGSQLDNCNCDGYTSSIYTISISSTSERGHLPWYVEKCSSILATVYGSGNAYDRGIVTTDLNNTCTKSHTGTSASAPLAAGIFALVLSANARLTWRDMQHLVVYNSRKTGLELYDWMKNGAGRYFSDAYGYGLINASAMVEMALNWTSVGPQNVCQKTMPHSKLPVSLGVRDHVNLPLNSDGCSGRRGEEIRYLEHVQAKVTFESTQRGEVELWLMSPQGTMSKLLSKRPNDKLSAGFNAWPFMSVHFWGESPLGTWRLIISSGNSEVSLYWACLIFYGTNHKVLIGPEPSNQRQVRNSSDAVTIRTNLFVHILWLNFLFTVCFKHWYIS